MKPNRKKSISPWIYDILMVCVLLIGGYFRMVGIDWGENQYLHPDERFMVWVGSDIAPVQSLSEYFDTPNSTLNPNNRGHGFYVYGTLPMFIARYIVEWVYGYSGFSEMTAVGRPLSALVDLLTVLLVYLVAVRLYGRRVGVLAGAFYALAVLPIQLSHFYKEDTFLNFFTFLAIYFAVKVGAMKEEPELESGDTQGGVLKEDRTKIEQGIRDRGEGNQGAESEFAAGSKPSFSITQYFKRFVAHPFFILSIGFGVALGCAMASKLNAVPVALMLPAAFVLRLASQKRATGLVSEERRQRVARYFGYLVLAAFVSVLVFRIFQPYAFSGPGFFGLKPNPQWVDNIREQRNQATGDVDFPPALQWARRPIWFSGLNLVVWGLGLPLGLLAWAGFLWAGWRILATWGKGTGDWQRHALLWGWTAFYFIWQSLAFNPTMRYQLPIYPALGIFAAWAVIGLWDQGSRLKVISSTPNAQVFINLRRIASALIGGIVLIATFMWAFAFTRTYTRPVTRVAATRWIYQNIPGSINLSIQGEGGTYNQPVPYQEGLVIWRDQPFVINFTANAGGALSEVFLNHVVDLENTPGRKELVVTLARPGDEHALATAALTSDLNPGDDPRGEGYLLTFDQPVSIAEGEQYELTLALQSGDGSITLAGSAPANESTWDDGLPLRMDSYDGYAGIYEPGLNFEMYWDDNVDKLERFTTTLDEADYIFITSNRQWGTTTRVPERYPLTTTYYRHLIGCPPEESVIWCYRVAQVGTFRGDLGFELVKVFESYPNLGPIRVNDQFAEEAFTVYDHPKVFIFRKTGAYDPVSVRSILGAVDLTKVIHVTPRKTASHPANLLLPSDRWSEQTQGGTWSQLFDTSALQNRFPLLGVLVWYASVALLGLLVYPLVRLGLPGLADRGYPLARIVGLLLLSYLVWLAGSFRIPFSRFTISLAMLILAVVSGILVYRQRDELRQEWRQRSRYFLLIEGLFLTFFVVALLIRLGNPDLWHPWKGGEKPMDFAYFNAVLKSTSFPPYDPWYAGGYLNYYYYGFVLVGVLVKWLGIVPAVAYNLILPTVFSLIAMGAFSLGWNLVTARGRASDGLRSSAHSLKPLIAGLASALGMAVLGNLGTVRMIVLGYQKLIAPDGVIEGAGVLTRGVWTIRGFILALTGTPLPYGIGDWYWIPSRAIRSPGEVEPITEFPSFTVLYADLHAHLFALPIALLVLAFALSVVMGRGRWKGKLGVVTGFMLGGLAIGALRPTNTSDFYPYLALGSIAVGYAIWFNFDSEDSKMRTLPLLGGLPDKSRRFLVAGSGVVILVTLSLILYQPYAHWSGFGYGKIDLWKGIRTPLGDYFTHWGLFLFVIVSWMTWETREWLASTPVSALHKLKPYRDVIYGLAGLLVILTVALGIKIPTLGANSALDKLPFGNGVHVAWVVLPLAAWAGVLLLRPHLPDAKRFVLFLVGTGLVLTLMVEIIVVRGDVARMNTVFKFYLQVWTLFSICAAAALGWLLSALPGWFPRWRTVWQVVLVGIVASAALYPLMAGMAKVKDRMTSDAPHTLDGMAYMAYAQYRDEWGEMDLSQDYRAIRWMQENVTGSPVIVEANLRNLYHWGSRFSVYTGLPGVVGWEWHQQQQRTLLPSTWVSDRIEEIDDFYTTTDLYAGRDFLIKYDVRYVIVGQQERGHYPGPGLDKFSASNGVFWREVYRDNETVIYETIEQ